jgi:hypothetical protein
MVTVPHRDLPRPSNAVVVSVASEAEVLAMTGRGLDSPADTDSPRYRHYEIAGTGHAVTAAVTLQPGFGWEVIHFGESGTDPFADQYPHPNKPLFPLFHALWHNVEAWVRDGTPMPRTARIERDAEKLDGVARDRYGNALGGVRSCWLEVPDAQYVARCPHHSNFGYIRPLPSELDVPMPDPAERDRRIRGQLKRMVDDGWLLAEDTGVFLDAVTSS